MMQFRVRELMVSLEYQENDLWEAAARRLRISQRDILELKLVKRAVDARRNSLHFTCSVDIILSDRVSLAEEILASPQVSCIKAPEPVELAAGVQPLEWAPVVVGSGPAGLFCALFLARQGYRPLLVERGSDVDRRIRAVEKFWREGALDASANPQFGEGGAGTFSDGKLTTRSGDRRVDFVLQTFVEHGASEEILYTKKPHVGTDVIRRVVKEIRAEILERGGEVCFDACLTDLDVNQGSLKRIIINNEVEIPVSVLVLAVGNSARDVYRLLQRRGISLTPKAFAVGVRVEHPQGYVDQVQYGDFAGHPRLGAADYQLTYQDRESGRSLYTFCMCPGGYVIAASSGEGQVVTNGMSYLARDSGVANSALVVTVTPADWGHTSLGGVEMQEHLESGAFSLGGAAYQAPAQLLGDFMQHRSSRSLQGSLATYRPGSLRPISGNCCPKSWVRYWKGEFAAGTGQ